jgi:hypothetical protein
MQPCDEPDLSAYTRHDIELFLSRYELLVRSLPEVAEWWPTMDDFERSHARSAYFGEGWGPRRLVGGLLRARKCTPQQERRLAELDGELLNHLDEAALCYELDLQDVLDLFRWGTPLEGSDAPLRLQIHPARLTEMAARSASDEREPVAVAA